MLNSVRYAGFGVRLSRIVWLQPLAAPAIIAACGPRRINVAISTRYDTDMFEPVAMGNCTLKPEVSADTSTSQTSGSTGDRLARGSRVTNSSPPTAMTARMSQRAGGGKIPKQGPSIWRAARSPDQSEAAVLCRPFDDEKHVFVCSS